MEKSLQNLKSKCENLEQFRNDSMNNHLKLGSDSSTDLLNYTVMKLNSM